MTPFEGLAFFTSAISLIGPSAARAAKKSRGGGADFARSRSSLDGSLACAAAISCRLVAMILSRMVIVWHVAPQREESQSVFLGLRVWFSNGVGSSSQHVAE